jgi:hypothetical protein
MDWIQYVVAAVFSLLGIGCLALTAVGLPGTWVMLCLAVIVELVDGTYLSGSSPTTFSWWAIGGCAALAVIGEVIEFATGAVGAKAGGASRRGMWGALIGGFLGAIVLTPIIPIPVVGTLLGALFGTFLGALVAERSHRDPEDNAKGLKAELKAASGATIGRLLGTVAKTAIAMCVWITLSILAFWPS